MEATLTVRLDADLKETAESTFDKMGLPMSMAIRLFLSNVVATRKLPFEVAVPASPEYRAPPAMQTEVVLELMVKCMARLQRLMMASTNPEEIRVFQGEIDHISAERYRFDYNDPVQLAKMRETFNARAMMLRLLEESRAHV